MVYYKFGVGNRGRTAEKAPTIIPHFGANVNSKNAQKKTGRTIARPKDISLGLFGILSAKAEICHLLNVLTLDLASLAQLNQKAVAVLAALDTLTNCLGDVGDSCLLNSGQILDDSIHQLVVSKLVFGGLLQSVARAVQQLHLMLHERLQFRHIALVQNVDDSGESFLLSHLSSHNFYLLFSFGVYLLYQILVDLSRGFFQSSIKFSKIDS